MSHRVARIPFRWYSPVVLLLAAIALTVAPAESAHGDESPFATSESALDQRLASTWRETVYPLFQKHCGDCHLGTANEGGVNFEDYNTLDKIRAHASTWEQIRGVVRAEAMPPPDSSQIAVNERASITEWIESALHDVDCSQRYSAPAVTLRRHNQLEYDNTIRDLIGPDVRGIEFRPSKEFGFVSDDVGNGFDNQGEVLTLPPIAIEKYLQAAASISHRTIAKNREKFRRQHFGGEQLNFGQSMTIPLYINPGKYRAEVRCRFGDGQSDTCHVQFKLDEQMISEWDVPSKDDTYKFEFEATARECKLILTYSDDASPENRNASNRKLNVESIRVIGPESGVPSFPKSHDRLVVAYPDQVDAPGLQPIGFSEAVRRVFKQFLPRAYRRNVSDEEVQEVVIICEKAHDAGFDFEDSLQFGLQATLVSPQFLFRSERNNIVDGVEQIDDFSLASRLSYFLWSTMPDETLLNLASEGKLHEPATFEAQVNRMIEDPKADALLSGFFAQWLGLRNLNKLELNADKFPVWSDRLRNAMLRETELFCGAMLREGRVIDMLMADYTFVNPRLAEFYGIEYEGRDPSEMYRRKAGRRGNDQRRLGLYDQEDRFIRVTLPASRRGLVTQAAVLALTSNPTHTSPVKRGKWILENLLGDPPPSAPPNVPSLEKSVADDKASLRERLEIHRANPSCAGCHKLMDPIGLGLENFDVIGRWREKDGEIAIAPQGELADGRSFTGPAELVQLLSTREDAIARNFVARMLTFALGRGLQREDRCDIDRILEASRASGYSIRAILHGIVRSDAFLQKSYPKPNPSQPGGE